MLADIDGLKKINDTHGHEAGSQEIIEFGEILRKSFRNSDVIARFGGDEFVILIINTLDEVKEKISGRLDRNITRYNLESTKPYELSVSYGLIKVEFGSAITIQEAINFADAAMYEHKQDRRKSI